MITVLSTLNSAPVLIELPETFAWGIYFPLMQAKRVAVAGNTIIQIATKSLTGGSATYDNEINADDADNLVLISRSAITVTLTDFTGVFEATMDAGPPSITKNGKKRIALNFSIVRQIL